MAACVPARPSYNPSPEFATHVQLHRSAAAPLARRRHKGPQRRHLRQAHASRRHRGGAKRAQATAHEADVALGCGNSGEEVR